MLLCFLIKFLSLIPQVFCCFTWRERQEEALWAAIAEISSPEVCFASVHSKMQQIDTNPPHSETYGSYICITESSFCHLFFFFSYWPLSIQHPFNVPSFILERRSASERQSRQNIYIKQRKKRRGPKRKQTELIQILHSNNRNNSNQKMIRMREGNADDGDDDEVQLILALSRKTLRPLSGSPQDMRICSEECSSAWYVFIFMRKYHRKGYILKEVPSCTSIQIGKGPEEVQKVIGP